MKKHIFLILATFFIFSAPAFADNVIQRVFKDIETYITGMNGFVVDIKGNSVTIDLGSEQKAIPGLKLTVFSEGEDIIHPVTGKTLGKKQDSIGSLTVTKVEKKYSIASFAGSSASAKDSKAKTAKLPVKSDKVGINVPVKMTISFDNATEEDMRTAGSITAASNTYRESGDSDSCKLMLQRTGKTVSFILQQANGVVIFSGNAVEQDGEVSDAIKPLFATDLPKGRYVSIAMGMIYKDDPKLYLVGVVDDRVVVFDPSAKYAVVEEVQIKQSQLLNIEIADLDGDGQDEIFLSNVVNSSEASSFVYKHDGKGLKQIQNKIPWLFRSVRDISGARRRITAQKITSGGDYNGEIFYYKYNNGIYTEDTAIKGTLGKFLFGFSVYMSDKGELFLNIGKGSKLSISSFKKNEYNVPGYYGDTFHVLPMREKKRVTGKSNPDAYAEYLDKRIFITPRIEIADEERFVIAQNDLYSRIFTASPVFSESSILLFTYKYGILKKVGGTASLQPVIVDMWIYEEDGKRYLVALTSNNKWVLQTGASSVTVYELP
ncbi:MAG: hypothetical protein LBH05_01855 [Deferribacteraceae bacterium]|jgi:RNase P/RNase MRP subunit p29|nr:hypothetical protein [Deferribacteraceae bacterium]